MNTIRLISMLSLAIFGACAASSDASPPRLDPDTGVVVLPTSSEPVSGTAFTCSSHSSSVLTPCDQHARPHTGTDARDLGDGTVELGLARSSIEADGAVASARIALTFAPGGELTASAEQWFQSDHTSLERRDARTGWIEPVATSPTAAGRNAGRFSLSFDWGTVSGTYDTAD
jgi:hypothetical protein